MTRDAPFLSPSHKKRRALGTKLGTQDFEVLDFRTSGHFRFKMAVSQSKLEDSLFKALNHLNLQSLTLQEEQVNAIRNIVGNQKDFLVVLPTGFGKSLIFQWLLFVFESWLDVDNSFILVVSRLKLPWNRLAKLTSSNFVGSWWWIRFLCQGPAG